jgi:hypothetical protein
VPTHPTHAWRCPPPRLFTPCGGSVCVRPPRAALWRALLITRQCLLAWFVWVVSHACALFRFCLLAVVCLVLGLARRLPARVSEINSVVGTRLVRVVNFVMHRLVQACSAGRVCLSLYGSRALHPVYGLCGAGP